MRKSLMAKIASVSLGISMLGFGNVKAVNNNVAARDSVYTANTKETSKLSREVALLLNIPSIASLGFMNLSYLYQGKWVKALFAGPIGTVINIANLMSETQTDSQGKLITNKGLKF